MNKIFLHRLEQAKERGRKGALIKGVKAKERKKTLKESLEILFKEIMTDKEGNKLTVIDAIIKSLMKQAGIK